MEVLVRDLMHIAALALDLPQTYFDNKIDRHVSAMRINYYPPHSDPIPSEQLRAGAHTDFGLFTILLGEDGTGGLQVRTTNGEWIDVATSPDFFVVNIGDLFMRWTNDTWVSNLHRVRNPSLGAVAPRRLSIGFFHQPNYDALIECISSCTDPNNPPRYEPVRSGDYRDHKYRQTDVTGNI